MKNKKKLKPKTKQWFESIICMDLTLAWKSKTGKYTHPIYNSEAIGKCKQFWKEVPKVPNIWIAKQRYFNVFVWKVSNCFSSRYPWWILNSYPNISCWKQALQELKTLNLLNKTWAVSLSNFWRFDSTRLFEKQSNVDLSLDFIIIFLRESNFRYFVSTFCFLFNLTHGNEFLLCMKWNMKSKHLHSDACKHPIEVHDNN